MVKFERSRLVTILVALLAAVALACGPAATPTPTPAPPTPTPTEVAAGPTPTPTPTATPIPEPTATPTPGEPVKIGAFTSLSGPFQTWGIPMRDGMKMAAKELNAQGGVLGGDVVIVERDTRNNPDEAMTALRELAERENVVAAGGVISSDVGTATSRVAEQIEVPLFLTESGSHRILSRDSRFTFRTCLAAGPMMMGPIRGFIQEKGFDRVGAVIADYAWGRSIEDSINDLITPLEALDVQIEAAPVGEKDFTTYLRRLQPFEPDIVIFSGHPPGTLAASKQAIELGVGKFMTGPGFPPDLVMKVVGQAGFGNYVDWSCADFEDPEYQALARRYYNEYGRLMPQDGVSGYTIVQMVADAIERTGSREPAAIATAIREGSFKQPGHAWPLSYTEWGEMKEAAPVLWTLKGGGPPGRVNPGADWHPEVLFRSSPLEPYVPQE